MKRVFLTKPAAQDLEEIYRYIAQDNTAAADKHRQRLEKLCLALVDHPRMGMKRDEIQPGLRSLAEGSYIIFYRSDAGGIQVVRVLHGSRDAQRAFAQSSQ